MLQICCAVIFTLKIAMHQDKFLLKLFSIFRTCKSDKRRPLSTDYPNLCPTLEMVPNAADYCNSQNRSVHLVVSQILNFILEEFQKLISCSELTSLHEKQILNFHQFFHQFFCYCYRCFWIKTVSLIG